MHTEPAQPYLEPDTLLVEYFCVHGALIAFLASDQDVVARRLDCDLAEVQRLMQHLWLNLRMVPGAGPTRFQAGPATPRACSEAVPVPTGAPGRCSGGIPQADRGAARAVALHSLPRLA